MNLTTGELSLMGSKSGFLGGLVGGLITGLLFGLLLLLQGFLKPQNYQTTSLPLIETIETWGSELVVMVFLFLVGLSISVGILVGSVMGLLGGILSGIIIAQAKISLSQNWQIVGAGIGGILGLTVALLFLIDDVSWLKASGRTTFPATTSLVYIFLAGGIMGGIIGGWKFRRLLYFHQD
jgi:hypothetical protein